jgi:hypothetical protein
VWARGQEATGDTRVALAWLDADDNYLGLSQSSALPPGTTKWTKLTAKAKAPPNAATVQVHLKSGYDDGTAFFDDVTFHAA